MAERGRGGKRGVREFFRVALGVFSLSVNGFPFIFTYLKNFSHFTIGFLT
jgi:hypothetical protein